MAIAVDVSQLLSHPRRRGIAQAVLDAPRSIGEIAEVLETKDGAIRTIVENLERDGLLAKSDRPGKKVGTTTAQYQVDHADAAAVLARDRPPAIAWAVRTRDPHLSLMVGLRSDSAPDERDALLLNLRYAGVECVRLHIGEIFAPTALFEYAHKLAARTVPALPPAS
jgi:hypothetical protein